LTEAVRKVWKCFLKCRNCYPGSLDNKKVAGKIVICANDDQNLTRKMKKLILQDAGAMGMILIEKENLDAPFDAGLFPFTEVGNLEGLQILKYIKATK